MMKMPKNTDDEDSLLNAKWTNLQQTKSCPKDFLPLFEQNCSQYAKKETYVFMHMLTGFVLYRKI